MEVCQVACTSVADLGVFRGSAAKKMVLQLSVSYQGCWYLD